MAPTETPAKPADKPTAKPSAQSQAKPASKPPARTSAGRKPKPKPRPKRAAKTLRAADSTRLPWVATIARGQADVLISVTDAFVSAVRRLLVK